MAISSLSLRSHAVLKNSLQTLSRVDHSRLTWSHFTATAEKITAWCQTNRDAISSLSLSDRQKMNSDLDQTALRLRARYDFLKTLMKQSTDIAFCIVPTEGHAHTGFLFSPLMPGDQLWTQQASLQFKLIMPTFLSRIGNWQYFSKDIDPSEPLQECLMYLNALKI